MGLVIDHHIHCVRQDPDMPAGFRRFIEQVRGEEADVFAARYEDPGALEALLDEAGIDHAVILAETNPVTSAWVPNEFVARFCRGRRRFIPFASVNPHLVHDPAGYLTGLVESMGFRGLKLYPTYQYYYPNDPLVYPMYAVCQAMRLPVMVHTGSSVFPGSRLARLHPNVYMELSGLPPSRLLTYFPELERVANKTIYGSDWPAVPSLGANILAIRQLPLSDKAKSAILGENAARIHGLRVDGGDTG